MPDKLALDGERVEELPVAPVLQKDWRAPLPTVLLLLPLPPPPLLANSALLESLLESEWDEELFSRFLRLPFVSEFCCEERRQESINTVNY